MLCVITACSNPRNATPGWVTRPRERAFLSVRRITYTPRERLRYLQAGVLSRRISPCPKQRTRATPHKSHYRQLNYRLKALLRFFARALVIVKIPYSSSCTTPSSREEISVDLYVVSRRKIINIAQIHPRGYERRWRPLSSIRPRFAITPVKN